jgi:CoA:oxalate CoA-transferase
MVVQAMGGVMSLTGEEDGAPTRVGISIGDLAAGMFGAIGIQGALHERTSTSVGRRIDVAMLDSQVALLENALARYQIEGVVPGPIGSRHPSITPFATFSAEDGDMVVAAGNDTMFVRLCDALGAPHLKFDPRFATNGNRTENHRALAAAIEAVLTLRPVSDWLDRLNAAGVACAPLNDVADVMNDPHVLHRGMLIDLPTPGGGTLRVAGSPIKLDGGSQTKFQRAPLLDEHRLAILNELGLTTE